MNKMFSSAKAYLPAVGHDWLLPLYDPVVKLLGADIARRALLDQAKLQAGHRVLDIGCGTGTFATLSLMNQARFVSCEKVREGTMLFGILRFAYFQGRGA
jgi:SAM-dependent methyltransferase